MKTALRIAAFVLATSAVPTAAWAASVSSAHGTGSQSRAESYANGARASGTLTSLQGYPVYYEGKINLTGFGCLSSKSVGRYTADTTSRSAVTRGGTIVATLGTFCSPTSVNSRISRNISMLPDPSGNWSANY